MAADRRRVDARRCRSVVRPRPDLASIFASQFVRDGRHGPTLIGQRSSALVNQPPRALDVELSLVGMNTVTETRASPIVCAIPDANCIEAIPTDCGKRDVPDVWAAK